MFWNVISNCFINIWYLIYASIPWFWLIQYLLNLEIYVLLIKLIFKSLWILIKIIKKVITFQILINVFYSIKYII